jgi:hypothetical protein
VSSFALKSSSLVTLRFQSTELVVKSVKVNLVERYVAVL